MTANLGERLRQIRQKCGLSQRELAKRAGVTSATISLIEQSRVSPSVASLKKVLDGLSLTLAEFFASADPAVKPRVFYRATELVELGSDCSVASPGRREPKGTIAANPARVAPAGLGLRRIQPSGPRGWRYHARPFGDHRRHRNDRPWTGRRLPLRQYDAASHAQHGQGGLRTRQCLHAANLLSSPHAGMCCSNQARIRAVLSICAGKSRTPWPSRG